jgi:hypothetical protein
MAYGLKSEQGMSREITGKITGKNVVGTGSHCSASFSNASARAGEDGHLEIILVEYAPPFEGVD